MDLYIYTDESGVFDYIHNDIFVYGGVLFLSKEDRDNAAREYLHVESVICEGYDCELKASILNNKEKGKIFRSLNKVIKFGAIVKQNKIEKTIYQTKRSKQRYEEYIKSKISTRINSRDFEIMHNGEYVDYGQYVTFNRTAVLTAQQEEQDITAIIYDTTDKPRKAYTTDDLKTWFEFKPDPIKNVGSYNLKMSLFDEMEDGYNEIEFRNGNAIEIYDRGMYRIERPAIIKAVITL